MTKAMALSFLVGVAVGITICLVQLIYQVLKKH